MLKICLRKGYHTAHDDLVKYPPRGVKYEIPKFVTTSKNKFINDIKKTVFRFYIKKTNQPHSIFIPCSKDVSLIHACSGVIPKNKIPWVIDLEHVNSFVGFQPGRLLDDVKDKVLSYLNSDCCKKIIPWSNAAKLSILNGLSKNLEDKIEVICPAMHTKNFTRKENDVLTLLYVGNNFYEKGGREVVEAFNNLIKKYDIKLKMVTNAPIDYIKKYKNIEFYEPKFSREIMFKQFFQKSDIFVLPSYHDTFGVVFLEAMNFKLPIISTNVFAIPEIIGDAGILLNTPFNYYNKQNLFAWKTWKDFGEHIKANKNETFIKELEKSIVELVENGELRKVLGNRGRSRIENGKFSIKERNKKLKRVYEQALQ